MTELLEHQKTLSLVAPGHRAQVRMRWVAVALVTTVAQANSIWVLGCFLCSSALMVIVALPLSQFRLSTGGAPSPAFRST